MELFMKENEMSEKMFIKKGDRKLWWKAQNWDNIDANKSLRIQFSAL
jgi:hypothetical protein